MTEFIWQVGDGRPAIPRACWESGGQNGAKEYTVDKMASMYSYRVFF